MRNARDAVLLLALVGSSSVVHAQNVSVVAESAGSRVLLTMKNIVPDVPVVVERVEVPQGKVAKRGKIVDSSYRTFAIGMPLEPSHTVDIGSIEDVFNGGSTPDLAVAQLRLRLPLGQCETRNVSLHIVLRYQNYTQPGYYGIPVTWCNR